MSKVGGGVGEGWPKLRTMSEICQFFSLKVLLLMNTAKFTYIQDIQDLLNKRDFILIFLLLFFNIAVTEYDHRGTLGGAYFEYCVTPCQAPYVAS